MEGKDWKKMSQNANRVGFSYFPNLLFLIKKINK